MSEGEHHSTSIINKFKHEFRLTEEVPTSAMYECSECEQITPFKKGENFTPCPDCSLPSHEQGWYKTNEVLHFVSKNLNSEFSHVEGWSVKLAQSIADFAGNIWFVWFHIIWFGSWIYLNTGSRNLMLYGGFDPYPFQFLVLVVSLEAIFLATFILISQNILADKSEMRADLDYQVNLKVEKDVAESLNILSDLREGRLYVDKSGRIKLGEQKKRKK